MFFIGNAEENKRKYQKNTDKTKKIAELVRNLQETKKF